MQGEPNNTSHLNGSGATPLEPGDPRRIGAFTLLGVLGSGGMGRVYLGAVPGRFAAVKRVLPVLAEDADFLSHFGHELDNLARLPGGASVRLLASDRTAKPPWFATEYIPGVTLNEAIRLHGGPLPTEALWRLLREAAAGLRAVHAADVVHRDLKPSNVMLTSDGLSLIDFGVARAADQSRLTRTGMVIGTPAYMAPEQAVADPHVTGQADVFALGSLLLYASTGRPPFGDGSGPGLLYRVVHGEPDFGKLTETAPALAHLVRSCLAKDPAERPTAAQVVELTDGYADDTPWPAAVMASVEERAAFAATPPTAEELADLSGEEEATAADSVEDIGTVALVQRGSHEPSTAGADAAAATGPGAKAPRQGRRNRFVMLVVPVVVATGTTLTVALGPYEIGRQGAGPDSSAARPSATSSQPAPGNSGPADVTPSSAGPSSAGPSSSAPGSPSGQPSGAGPGGAAAGGAAAGGGAGGGGAAAGGTGSGPGGGGDAASGGGSTPSGGGGGSTPAPPKTTRPAPPPSDGGGSSTSGTYSLENVSNGQCVGEYNPGYGDFANTHTCGADDGAGNPIHFAWTYSPGANGTFRLVNKKTGHCLQSGGNPGGVGVSACNGSSNQAWKVRSTTSSGRTIMNVGNGQCMIVGPPFLSTSACDSGNRAQLWRNISAL
ncbi:protein kinase [Streptomyces sp. P9(2023)]|uniref:serine/threonine-protein kinase n=1 Tax=Streptomyces sp. P9(2023) TaxID=3064394 RepID=UPI0028F3F0DE|nr:protein kinase [Streptomyces sp. P9(2023)]MDT9690547.1 protein kinase [Streptomyces sp. P9(2023)]